MADVILAVIVLGPLALTFLLKSNAALAFLTLCAGFVLSTSVIGDLKQLLSQINLSTTSSTLGIILLVAPPVLTLLLTQRTHKKGIKFWLQLLVAVAIGGLLALAVGPILNVSSQFDITKSSFWDQLVKIQSEVIGVGALLSLLLVWLGRFKSHGKKHT
jgi:hypothetical protein